MCRPERPAHLVSGRKAFLGSTNAGTAKESASNAVNWRCLAADTLLASPPSLPSPHSAVSPNAKMLRPALWFLAIAGLACLATLAWTQQRVERADDTRRSSKVPARTSPAERLPSRRPTILKPADTSQSKHAERETAPPGFDPVEPNEFDPVEPNEAVELNEPAEGAVPNTSDSVSKMPQSEQLAVMGLPSIESGVMDHVAEQPKLPPAETVEEIAALSRWVLASDDGGRAPARLLSPAIAEANPLRRQPKLSPRMAKLKQRLSETLAYYRSWPVSTSNRSPWEVMHAAIAFGCESRLARPDVNRKVTALGHLCFNGACEGHTLLRVVDGRVVPRRGDGLQGHDGQLLAILAQSKVKMDYPVMAQGKKFTVADIVEHEKRSVRSGTELTFQLIGLMHYLRGEEEEWTNDEGEEWSIRRMLREEIDSPIRGAACGGTHRLMGISYAWRKREQRGFKITGQYKRARQYTEEYHRYTFRMQNEDGSFHTAWFRVPDDSDDIDVRVRTSGHIFEWLAFSLSGEQLKSDTAVAAAEYLTELLATNRDHEWKIGPLGHALHGLVLYEQRVFKETSGDHRSRIAKPIRKPERTALLPNQTTDRNHSTAD